MSVDSKRNGSNEASSMRDSLTDKHWGKLRLPQVGYNFLTMSMRAHVVVFTRCQRHGCAVHGQNERALTTVWSRLFLTMNRSSPTSVNDDIISVDVETHC